MAQFNLTTASALFKTKYVRLSRDMFNSDNIVSAKVKRNDSFVGDQALISVPLSFGCGVSSGSLPTPNPATYSKMTILAKKTYAVVSVDRETIKAADTDEGAFVRATKEVVKRGVQSWQRNFSRILFNDSTATSANGRLGTFSGNQALISAGVFDCTILTTGNTPFKLANFEPKDYVNVNSNPALFEITSVVPATGVVRLTQITGSPFDLSTIGAGTHSVYMQLSAANDPTGLRGILLATTGAAYGINIGYRWQASSQLTALAVGITPDLLNQQMLDVKYGFGETPDMIVTSFVQYRKLLNQLEDQKRYMMVESRYSGPKGKFSFQALEFMSDAGPVPVIAERFVENDTLYSLNSDFIEVHARPDAGWVDDDISGNIFLRSGAQDSFEARYAVYYENAIMPTAHGIMTGLTTT